MSMDHIQDRFRPPLSTNDDCGLIARPFTYVVGPTGTVNWIYASESAADRPSPVALAKTAMAVARGERL
jgi:hypothetical protein